MDTELIEYLDRRDAELKDYLERKFEAQLAQFNASMDRCFDVPAAHLQAVEARNIQRLDRLEARSDRLQSAAAQLPRRRVHG